ncbi:MAG: lysophospholipid acyltransferase family protein [Acidimicrobiales bacterium]|nr:lysophospholipid acyltransferase family protein [Acidimicrobiales bacterium]
MTGSDAAETDDSVGEKPAKSLEWAQRVGHNRSSLAFYRVVHFLIRTLLHRWLRTQIRGAEHLSTEGPVIIAPVHRSNLDAPLIAGAGTRRMRALGKRSLFTNPVSAWVCAALGAIPLRRGEADRDAMRAARTILDDGEMMIVFPEGTRQSGDRVQGVFDGMTYLANKTGAVIIPIGIAGTEAALASGSKGIKRVPTAVVVGEPIAAPEGRMSRPALTAFSEDVGARLQAVFDEANELIRT